MYVTHERNSLKETSALFSFNTSVPYTCCRLMNSAVPRHECVFVGFDFDVLDETFETSDYLYMKGTVFVLPGVLAELERAQTM